MLKNVHLKNFALIEEAQLDFTRGLNIMTGETGSGKSVIIGAINFALGAKANKSLIRTGAPSAIAELCFCADDEDILQLLDNLGIERSGSDIIITRKITPDSSISRINGETVTVTNLKKITSRLIDVHGQHDHQSLLNPANHMGILDDFASEKIAPLKKKLSGELAEYKELRNEFKKYDKDAAEAQREALLLEYEYDEIEDAGLISGEDIKLEEEFRAMNLARKTWDSLNKIKYIFTDEDSGLVQGLSDALAELAGAAEADPSLTHFKETLADADSVIKDFTRDITRHINENGFDAEKFSKVSARLNLINDLKSKYGKTIEEILSYQDGCAKRLENLKNFEETKADLSQRLSQSKSRINSISKKLSEERKKAAGKLEPLITENLAELNFSSCEFKINFEVAPKISNEGFDKARFMISLNPGQPPKPLESVASGGELSRIMLAIKSALAEYDHIDTLIFDEIDTGISGQTASKVSEKLKKLSFSHQVICITHLPQIAAKANSHFLIEKKVSDGFAISGARLLGYEEAVNELAKMISGSEVTAAALKHAKELKS